MKNKVIVPINFSKSSKDAIEFAIHVGKSSCLHIELVPCVDDKTPEWIRKTYETKGDLVYCLNEFLKSIRSSSALEDCDWVEVTVNLIPKHSLIPYSADLSDVLMVICDSNTINDNSCAAKFAAKVNCPIIFVGANEKPNQFQNVLFVGDY